ncbi:helix-turn-helix domain-containing protein [Janthinobacterium sp. PC23-8]|uniref:helix-turn-helix domain-containing protein n=1 Tax=Janthinobacterium sp. PC23-8 TaxID=2012679 RepID=UPI000B96E0D9|nr:helix-turn-helix domain-containing protein [Janthinobacterium sp. PC23-8]OYO30150.1 helix-turn-helix domain-containing protein [Janthinobacterium sp. PC23-8]
MNSERAEIPQQQPQGNLASAGAQLKAQRETLGWSVEQVADQLKLAPRQMVALEEGDVAALPNLAVVRGFVRAYAKVLRIDPAPLVAMIAIHPPMPVPEHHAAPARRDISATFSESRFPSMTQRSSHSGLWIAGVLVVAAAAFGAYKMGYVPETLFAHGDKEVVHAGVTAPVETTLVKPGQEIAPVQTPSVPLISVPPAASASAGASTDTPAPAPAAVPAPAPAAETPVAAPAVAGANALVLNVTQDSWVEIRRPGSTPLISRLVKAGSTETFDITGPAVLVVGKPEVVQATLRGAKLELPRIAGGTIARVNIK